MAELRIVIDTNVVISGVFFGGAPRKVLEAVVDGRIAAFASPQIVSEYEEIVQEMIRRKQGRLSKGLLLPLIERMRVVEPVSDVALCRDPDDDKFLNCAKDTGSLYIVSGDRDLLVIRSFEGIRIVTAAEFLSSCLA